MRLYLGARGGMRTHDLLFTNSPSPVRHWSPGSANMGKFGLCCPLLFAGTRQQPRGLASALASICRFPLAIFWVLSPFSGARQICPARLVSAAGRYTAD